MKNIGSLVLNIALVLVVTICIYNIFKGKEVLQGHIILADSLKGVNQLLYQQVSDAKTINNSLQDSLQMIVDQYHLQSQQVTLLEVTIDSLQASLIPISASDTLYIDGYEYHRYVLDTSRQDIFSITGNVLAKEPPKEVNFNLFQTSPLYIDILLAKTREGFDVSLVRSSSKLITVSGTTLKLKSNNNFWDNLWFNIGAGSILGVEAGYKKYGFEYLNDFNNQYFMVKYRALQ